MNILISGASIAGPALAFWLAKYGHEITVVERAPLIRPGGYAVDIRGSALSVVEQMNLREQLRPFETDTLSNAVVDSRGRIFGRVDRGFGVIDEGDVEIHRGDLAQILYERTKANATYRFGDSIAELEQFAHGVKVVFESGERRDYDVVIGADGVHSRTRALAFERDESAFVHHMGNAMAIFTVPNHIGLHREQLLFSGIGRVASVKCANDDRDLKVCVFFATAPGVFDYRDVALQKRLVADAFADAGWEFPAFLEAMKTSSDFYSDITCQIKMDRYFVSRVALVGDAAYCPSPLSGQGTSLALVGAYLLANEIGNGSDIEAAFERYDVRMRPFAMKNQEVAVKIARGFAPSTPFQAWSRNALMRVFPYLPGKSAIMKMAMGGVRDAARAITIPA
jgi:2-polyprenyl-6-methoxyphenol hydroxylase-like FAD-dependent oxidoreductase